MVLKKRPRSRVPSNILARTEPVFFREIHHIDDYRVPRLSTDIRLVGTHPGPYANHRCSCDIGTLWTEDFDSNGNADICAR